MNGTGLINSRSAAGYKGGFYQLNRKPSMSREVSRTMPTCRVNNIELYYEITGQGIPILFIHGLGSSARDWENQAPFFSRHFQVVTFDVRGHGRSDKPRGRYSIPLFASDTSSFMRTLNTFPAHIIGFSMGGMIAFQLAVTEPDLFRSVTAINSGPKFIFRTLKEKFPFLMRYFIVHLFGMRKMGAILGNSLFPKPAHKTLRDQFIQRWSENDKRAYIASMNALSNWTVMDKIRTIAVPTLIISADMDYTPVAWKEFYASKITGARVAIIHDSRHMTPFEQPEQLNQTIMTFLSNVD